MSNLWPTAQILFFEIIHFQSLSKRQENFLVNLSEKYTKLCEILLEEFTTRFSDFKNN
ncbi:hypothetical protein A3Q56_04981 [Intoshia linei]|uniref:Uncharacterized protein n=1 Tax=Intoshia linei TaxID=1819745 RepID=A0A177AZ41_9BILA|nr:hypothetical protein A3Q56_04981 [Intoshia linei]